MQLGMIGLGRMGGNIVRRLMQRGHSAVVYDKDQKAVAALAAGGATGAATLEDFVHKLTPPRAAWVMLPAGAITEATIETLAALMQKDDAIIDGGNSFWQDDVRRGKSLRARGLHYLDVGTSGGVWGLERYCMMIGGDRPSSTGSIRSLRRLRPAAATSRQRRIARAAIPASSRATFTPAPLDQGIS